MTSQQLWEALERSSRAARPTGRPFSSFESTSELVHDETNKFDLLCPRSECGSIILKAGVAKLLKKDDKVQIEPSDIARHPLLAEVTTHWWLITPSPMQFENIGFSKPVEALSLLPSGKKLKLLACAECDLGPLGWSEEGGSEFWLACTRLAYRDDNTESS